MISPSSQCWQPMLAIDIGPTIDRALDNNRGPILACYIGPEIAPNYRPRWGLKGVVYVAAWFSSLFSKICYEGTKKDINSLFLFFVYLIVIFEEAKSLKLYFYIFECRMTLNVPSSEFRYQFSCKILGQPRNLQQKMKLIYNCYYISYA